MLNHWFGARWFGYLGCSYERACYLRAPLESQTTSNPNQQLTISWLERRTSPSNWRVSYPSISRGVCGSFATRLHATASLAGGRLRELRERTCFFVEGDGVSWIYFWPLPPSKKKGDMVWSKLLWMFLLIGVIFYCFIPASLLQFIFVLLEDIVIYDYCFLIFIH